MPSFHPRVMSGEAAEEDPIKHGGSDIESFSQLENIDLTFGLSEELPGLKYLITVDGPFEFTRGFFVGTKMTSDPDFDACDRLIGDELVSNMKKVLNMTETIFQQTDFYKIMYMVFDNGLLITRITQMLHPTTLHCWEGGTHVYEHFYDIIVNQNGYNPKSYLLNIVYNFGGLFEAARELWLFFKEDPRGQLTNVHDAGYNMG